MTTAPLPSLTAPSRFYFSLIELMTVIMLIAIISGFLLPATASRIQDAKAVKAATALIRAKELAPHFKNQNDGTWPSAYSDFNSMSNVTVPTNPNPFSYNVTFTEVGEELQISTLVPDDTDPSADLLFSFVTPPSVEDYEVDPPSGGTKRIWVIAREAVNERASHHLRDQYHQ